jgi:hypothetical protein
MRVSTEALLLVLLGWGVVDCEIKGVWLNRRSLLAGFVIGVAIKVAVMLAPLGPLSTAQKEPPLLIPRPHVNETRFKGSGRGSPKTTPVAVTDPRLVILVGIGNVLPDSHFLALRNLGEGEVCACPGSGGLDATPNEQY